MKSLFTSTSTSSVINSKFPSNVIFSKTKYVFQNNKTQPTISNHGPIHQVRSKEQFHVFMDIPKRIYQANSGWIAPLWNDEKNFFKTNNHFWNHATCALFIAYQKDKPVGRIAALIDHLYMKHIGESIGFFGFYESINNPTVANQLLSTAESWLGSQRCTKMIGPINGRVDNGSGFLLNRYETNPTILDSYSPDYYIDFMKNYQMKKHRDLLTFSVDLTQPLSDELHTIAQKTKEEHHLTIRSFQRWKSRSELKWWIPFFLSTFSSHWGYIPVDPKEVRQRYGLRNIRWVGDTDLFLIAEQRNDPVGFLWGTPDYNQIFKKLNGSMDLILAIRHMNTLKTIDYGKLHVIGVKPDYRSNQIALLLNYEVLKRMKERGYRGADIGWIDEHNKKALSVIEKMKAPHHKTFRVFEKGIDLLR